MVEMIEANWLAFLLAVVLAVLVALWLLKKPKKPRERSHRPDVLDEGVGPAKRNQALIDAPSAGPPKVHEPEPPATPETLAGVGTAVAAAVLANEPGVDEDRVTDHHQIDPTPAPQEPDHMPASADDAQAVAAAMKIHAEDVAEADDLSKIKGVGPKLLALLSDIGISRYDQIAAWNDDDVQRIDAQLGNFAGRIERDDWRTQARYLAEGDVAGYEDKFGKL